jgi:hypothetical protein
MRRTLGAFILFASVAATMSAQALTAADRDKAMKYLESTRQGVIQATAGLSEAQWKFKAGPDRWSIAEVSEHIAAAEDLLRGLIEEQVLKAPARPEGEDVAAIDAFVLKAIPDRSQKAQAPEPLKPTNRFGSPEAAVKHFTAARDKTEALLKERQDLRAHAFDSPLGKKLDAYEWILFIAAHSDRHTKQILEVEADPGFPKK